MVCAVSGGADSLALLVLGVEAGCQVTAIHVDHGLRPGSAGEAEVVRAAAERFGAAFRAERVAVGESRPDLTIILDVPAAVGRERARGRHGIGTAPAERFEGDELWLQEERRQAFLDIAKHEPERCIVVDATQSEDEVAHAVWKAVSTRLFGEAAA